MFAPFPGFEPFPFYRNYSEPFFDGRHYVLKGASPRTAACLLRPRFRNWFRPAYPYVYATFRLVAILMYAQALDGEFAREVRAGLKRPGAEDAALPLFLRCCRFGAVRGHYPLAGVRAYARRCAHSGTPAPDSLSEALPRDVVVAELGSGTGAKTRFVLESCAAAKP